MQNGRTYCKEWNIAEEIIQKQEKVAWKSEPTFEPHPSL
jgi:hypothetical protein